MLPLLPVYISYFGGSDDRKVGLRAAAFVAGFSLVFCLLGLFAGTLSVFLVRYRKAVNIVTGAIVVLLGLSYLNIIPLPFLKGMQKGRPADTVLSAFLLGLIYSVSLTPCIGAFLGAALMMASVSESSVRGVLLLLCYSLGLGVPFVLSAVLIKYLKSAFDVIKKHYKVINIVCGCFLIVMGILMMLGLVSRFMRSFI